MRNTAKRKWGGMEIELLDLPDLGLLELEWRNLEARSEVSHFYQLDPDWRLATQPP